MTKKTNSFIKSLTINLPLTSKLRKMIESNESLEVIIEQARFEKECMAHYDQIYQHGKTGGEIICEMGYAQYFKDTTNFERQKYYGYISHIFAVAIDLNEDEDYYNGDDV